MSMTVHRGGMLTISGNQNDLVAKLNDEKNIEALQKKLTENEKNYAT